MESKHTPTPWRVGRKSQRSILSTDGITHIAQALPNHEADAVRIVDCVNACEGQNLMDVECATAHKQAVFVWETEMMKAIGEDGVGSVSTAIAELKQQRDELQRWKNEALATFNPIFDFEHPNMKLGESKVEFILALAKQRDAYVAQDKEIRTLIDADENESTYDEVARLKAQYDKLSAIGKSHIDKDLERICKLSAALTEAAKLLDECQNTYFQSLK